MPVSKASNQPRSHPGLAALLWKAATDRIKRRDGQAQAGDARTGGTSRALWPAPEEGAPIAPTSQAHVGQAPAAAHVG